MKRTITTYQTMIIYAISGCQIFLSGLLLMLDNRKIPLLIALILLLFSAFMLCILDFCHKEELDERLEIELLRAKAVAFDILIMVVVVAFSVIVASGKLDVAVISKNLGIFTFSLLLLIIGFYLLFTGLKFLLIEKKLRAGLKMDDDEDDIA